MKLAILGASVSAQRLHRETGAVTGYAEVLRQRHQDALGFREIRQIVHPGNRMSDAGIMRVETVVDFAPDICLIEPLVEDGSRGSPARPEEIAHIYGRLAEAGIVPVTLMLPEPPRQVEQGPAYPRYAAFCEAHDLPVIRIDLPEEALPGRHFRGIHTREAGALFYADHIAAELARLDLPALRARLPPLAALRTERPIHVERVRLTGPQREGFARVRLAVECPGLGPTRLRLIQLQTIGPHSPLIEVTARAEAGPVSPDREFRSVWDRQCHFTRDSYITLADVTCETAGLLNLTVARSDRDPDYAACARPDVTWPGPADREMRPKGAFLLVSDRLVRGRQIMEDA